MATMDEEGRVKLVGRTKEMIIKGGENIYPKEIEEVLFTHPLVHSAAVFGLPHERYGETVSCWIKLRDPSKTISEQEIKEFCKDKVAVALFHGESLANPNSHVYSSLNFKV